MSFSQYLSLSRSLVPSCVTSNRQIDSSRLTIEESVALDTFLHRAVVTEERNPEPQHPVVLCIDNSTSMLGQPIAELNAGIQNFAAEIRQDALIARSVVLGLFGFGTGDRSYKVLHPFAPPTAFRPPTLRARTGTPHCQRLSQVVPLTAALSEGMRKAFDVPVRHAWLFDFTDGQPQDLHLHRNAIHASKVFAAQHNIECLYFGVGPHADLEYLRTLEQPRKPAKLLTDVDDWKQFFRWLHQSLRSVSQSIVGDFVVLPDFTGSGPSFRMGS